MIIRKKDNSSWLALGLKVVLTLVLTTVALQVLRKLWNVHQELAWTTVFIVVVTLVIGFVNWETQAVELDTESSDVGDQYGVPWWLTMILGPLALYFGFRAFNAAMASQWTALGLNLLGGAAAWRFCLPNPLPKMSNLSWKVALAAVVAAAAVYRLYKVGDIPLGFAGVDEALLWTRAENYAGGFRETYARLGGFEDGAIPLYMEGLGLKIFGGGFKGWRMEAALGGVFLAYVMYKIGRETAGRWVGILAGGLWAVSLWSVTISRAQYFMIETYIMVLCCLCFVLMGINKSRGWVWALAGMFWGFTFNTYPAARVMLALVPWLIFMAWYMRPDLRNGIQRALLPLTAGLAVGIAPLAWWIYENPRDHFGYYTGVFRAATQAGTGDGTLIERIDSVLKRCFMYFPANFSAFTSRGSINPNYFPYQHPWIQPALLYLTLVGASVSLARFRRPAFAFLIFWWFAGLIPALASMPGTVPNERRAMMVLPPMIMLAAVGFAAFGGVACRVLGQKFRKPLAIFLLGAGMVWIGHTAWNNYFERNQKDYGLITWSRASGAAVIRAVYDENEKGPVAVINTRRLNHDVFFMPGFNPYRGREFPAVNPTVPVMWAQEKETYYSGGGLFGALNWAVESRIPEKPGSKIMTEFGYDAVVVLTPFYFYLEPLLQRLGGKEVKALELLQSTQGPVRGDISFGYDFKYIAKLYRINQKDFGRMREQMKVEQRYPLKLTEISPPGSMSRGNALALNMDTPQYRQLVQEYFNKPGAWKEGLSKVHPVPDLWFWATIGELGIGPPFKTTVSLRLKIAEDGQYRFGASSTLPLMIKLNGKRVFARDPTDPDFNETFPEGQFTHDPGRLTREDERRGYLGDPIDLKKGEYRLDVNQISISTTPVFGHLMRLIWNKDGGEWGTLSPEVFEPWDAAVTQAKNR